MVKVLFLHGLFGNPKRSIKVCSIQAMGYKVLAPQLSNWRYSTALKTAKEALKWDPDVIVGSSRGGAIAIQLESDKPLLLLAPAWKYYGVKSKITTPCYILHGINDTTIPFNDSLELNGRLIALEDDHHLNSIHSHLVMKVLLDNLVYEPLYTVGT